MKKKFILIVIVLIFLGLSLVFYFNKKNPVVLDNNKDIDNQVDNIPAVSYYEQINDNLSNNTSTIISDEPRLLTEEEKEKYGVTTDKPVYIEMVEGNEDFPGPFSVLILPPEETAGSPPVIDTNKDSDNDGLTDTEELKIYGTDPKNSDTDGDGYLDGVEVTAGQDPKK